MFPLGGLRPAAVALGALGVAVHPQFGGLLWIPVTLAYLVLLWPHRHRPAAFQVRPGRLVVPPSPLLGLVTLLTAYYVARMVWQETPTHGPSHLMAVLIAAHGIGIAWLPRITLTPDGIEVRRFLTRRIPWAAIAPDSPAAPAPGARSIEMLVQRPNGSWRSEILLRGVRHIDEAFLAGAIRAYAGSPGRRAEIGALSSPARRPSSS